MTNCRKISEAAEKYAYKFFMIMNDQDFKRRLELLAQQLSAEVSKLTREDGSRVFAAEEMRDRLRREIKARRAREQVFPPALFADPAWDILLDLTLARLEKRQTSVSSLCIAATVPTTTALRWIKILLNQGLIERRPDSKDKRRHYIDVSDSTFDTMLRLLEKSGIGHSGAFLG